jgi:copper resistance protein B
MNRVALLALLPLMWAAAAEAQPMDPNMKGMSMPAAKSAPATAHPTSKAAKKKPTTARRRGHRKAVRAGMVSAPRHAAPKSAAHDMAAMPGMAMKPPTAGAHNMAAMPGMTMPAPAAGAKAAGHDMAAMPGMTMPSPASGSKSGGTDMAAMPGMTMAPGAMPGMAGPPPVAEQQTQPPPVPTDHAAERDYDPAAMAASRAQLRLEHGGGTYSKVMANLAEYQARSGGGGYRWEGEAWFGGDLNRLVVKSEGEGSRRDGLEAAEAQVLYSRAVGPYFNLQAGVRQDFKPTPQRTYATLGVEGLAPYWFDVQGAFFLSTQGELLARAEGTYDLRLTQRFILQPRAELNFAAQDTREIGIGSGLSNAELGLRLRYEIRKDFAPYIGVSYDQQFGRTADYSRALGQNPSRTSFVVGIRAWF